MFTVDDYPKLIINGHTYYVFPLSDPNNDDRLQYIAIPEEDIQLRWWSCGNRYIDTWINLELPPPVIESLV